MNIHFYSIYTVRLEEGWRITFSTDYGYPEGPAVGFRKVADILEKYLSISLIVDHHNYVFYKPKDESDEAFFIMKMNAMGGVKTNMEFDI